MARINNAITFGAGFNISAASPIDSRMRVQYESDLTTAATWNSAEAPLYDGLTTVVMETGDIWVLKDKTKYTDKTTGAGWINKGKGSEIDDNSSANNKTWSAEKISTELSGKQDVLTAGQNIVITNNTISAVIDAGFSVEVVQTLPTTGEVNTIYFVPKAGGANPDIYDEYMYINNAWEKIGSTEVDLSNYYNKTEVDGLLAGKQATLTAGNNITINGTTISANDTTYSAGQNINITNNVIKANGYRYNTTNGAFAEGDRDIDESGTTYLKSTATGRMAHAEGCKTTASTDYSHTEGLNTSVTVGGCGHAEGNGSKVQGGASHAEGQETTASGYYSHSEGYKSKAQGASSHAEGNTTTASGDSAHSEGYQTKAVGGFAHAEGVSAQAYGSASHAEGSTTKTVGDGAHAEGYNTETGGNYTSNTKTAGVSTGAGAYAHAEGNATIANGVAAHSEGRHTLAKGNHSHAEGAETVTNGGNSHAEGRFTKTLCNAEHAQGSYNVSHNATVYFDGNAGNTVHSTGIGTADDARKNAVEVMQNGDAYLLGVGNYDGIHIKGETGAPSGLQTLQETIRGKQDALTAGDNIYIDASNNINAEGYVFDSSVGSIAAVYRQDVSDGGQIVSNTATGLGSHAEGYGTTASGDYGSHAEGSATIANGAASHAEGNTSNATGLASHAEGRSTASANYAHAENRSTASAKWAHSEGYETTASGEASHAEGCYTVAVNYYAHSEGYQTSASGATSHSEGVRTIASGEASHAEGYGSQENGYNTASGNGSHSEGVITIAQNMGEHAEGFYNKSHKGSGDGTAMMYSSENTIHSIGIGNTSSYGRKNAVEVMQNGDVYILDVGGYDGMNLTGNTIQTVINGKQDTLTAGSGITIVNNVISATGGGGGGSTVGYTYDSSNNSIAIGYNTTASGTNSYAEGYSTQATGDTTHAEGRSTKAYGQYAHAEGVNTTASGSSSHTEGYVTTALNQAEHAQGMYNNSHKLNTTFGSSGNTLHSIGIGSGVNDKKNVVEVMQNGDVYIRGIGGYDGINLSGDTLQAVISSILTRLTALEPQPTSPPLNQIWYTTTTGQPVAGSVGYMVTDEDTGGSNSVVSNTYQNGKGVITFDSSIGSMAYWGSEEDCGNIIEKVWLPYVTEQGSVAYMLSSQTNLTDVYYPGTTTECAVICNDFEAEPMSGALTNVIHCSDGDYTVPSA